MNDFREVTDPVKLRSYLVYTVQAYQSLAGKFQEQNEQLITQLANNTVTLYDLHEKEQQVEKLTKEIVNLYRELGETQYGLSINIDALIPNENSQLHFEFVDGLNIS
jgi:hypothetical protein